MTGYLKNYCMLNKQAIDKILKKHDKNSYFDSRGTVNNAVSHLSFFKQRDLSIQQQRIENLWRMVDDTLTVTSSLLLVLHPKL